MSLLDPAFLRILEQLQITARRVQGATSESGISATQRGGSFEVIDRRPYTAGDDVRSIDWAASGRSDRLYVKEFAREQEARIVLALDASASMGARGPESWEHARRLAAAVAAIALSSGAPLRLGLCRGERWEPLAPTGEPDAIHAVLRFLEATSAQGPTRLASALARGVALDPRRALWIVVSDLFDGAEPLAALSSLTARGSDVVCLDHAAADAGAIPEGLILCEDAESGERREYVVDARVREQLREAEEARRRRWSAFAASHGILYLPVTPAMPVEGIVLDLLRRVRVVA